MSTSIAYFNSIGYCNGETDLTDCKKKDWYFNGEQDDDGEIKEKDSDDCSNARSGSSGSSSGDSDISNVNNNNSGDNNDIQWWGWLLIIVCIVAVLLVMVVLGVKMFNKHCNNNGKFKYTKDDYKNVGNGNDFKAKLLDDGSGENQMLHVENVAPIKTQEKHESETSIGDTTQS